MRTLDFYNFYRDLGEEEKMIWDAAQKFVDQPELIKKIRECNIKEEPLPREYITAMGSLDFLGADLRGYGCPGVSSLSYGLIMLELEKRDSALRSTASVQGGLVMHSIFEYGSDAQKEKWLPLLQRGEAIGCFGLTEPHGGSNPKAITTTAKTDGNFYIINGSKTWITNGSIADLAVVWAKTEKGRIGGFLIEKDTPGFSTTLIKNKWALRASVTSQLFFEDCKIPKENLLPGTKIGLKAALSCLNHARYGISWGVIGAAISCYECALEFAGTRQPFGKPIASYQLTQAKLSWMVKEITKAQLTCLQLAHLRESGELTHEQISLAKWNNVNIALRIANKARSILGADGTTYDYPVGPHLLNLEAVKTYEGTEEIHILNIGRKITGISAF